MAAFVPRRVFPSLDSLPRAYFLGHHKAGLDSMKGMLSRIDLVIECRDHRIPLTSRNPLFEESLGGRERLVVYTKKDLVGNGQSGDWERERKQERLIEDWQAPTPVLFTDHKEKRLVRKVLDFARTHAAARDSLTGSQLMVVGMPNVGKSSLLNALRSLGVHKGKAATTGAQPGVTRKIGTSVKIIEGTEDTEAVYLADTPGVFVPYVPDPEAMLKLALCGSVKDSVISLTILADYLLFQLNRYDPRAYQEYCEPTNDVAEFIHSVAMKTGRLQKGGSPNEEATALWIIQRWRTGHLGKFILDDINPENLTSNPSNSKTLRGSFSEAMRMEKGFRRQQAQLRRQRT